MPIKEIAIVLAEDNSEHVIDFIILQGNNFDESSVIEILSKCGNEYSKLTLKDGKHSNLEKTNENRMCCLRF